MEREREEGRREKESERERERGKERGDSLDWHQDGKNWAGVHSCSAQPGGSQR